jgi:hypothetical protein
MDLTKLGWEVWTQFKWVGIRINGSLLLTRKYMYVRVLRRMFDLERGGITGTGENCIMGSFIICKKKR